MKLTLAEHRRHLKFLEAEMWGRGRITMRSLFFTKCNPSINSSSHEALRYKTSGRHANEGLQSWSTTSAACPLPVSRRPRRRGAAVLSCSPRTCLSANTAQQHRESPRQLPRRAPPHSSRPQEIHTDDSPLRNDTRKFSASYTRAIFTQTARDKNPPKALLENRAALCTFFVFVCRGKFKGEAQSSTP